MVQEAIFRKVLDAGFVRVRSLSPFEPAVYSKQHRAVPENYQAGAPSLLIAALPYRNQHEPDPGFEPSAYIAPFAQRNYYREAVKRLQKLGMEFRSHYGGKKSDFRVLCNSPIPEKPLARAAGLGSLGRNSLIITPEAGSLVIIAAMTLPFALDDEKDTTAKPQTESDTFPCCKACDPDQPPCLRACPTNALRGDGTVHLSRCIQWYASGNGQSVPPALAQHWGNRLYGCTDCQDACIHNQRPIQGVLSNEGPLPAYLDPQELLSLGDEEIKARFKGTCLGLSWLGPAGVRRNASMVLNAYDLKRKGEEVP